MQCMLVTRIRQLQHPSDSQRTHTSTNHRNPIYIHLMSRMLQKWTSNHKVDLQYMYWLTRFHIWNIRNIPLVEVSVEGGSKYEHCRKKRRSRQVIIQYTYWLTMEHSGNFRDVPLIQVSVEDGSKLKHCRKKRRLITFTVNAQENPWLAKKVYSNFMHDQLLSPLLKIFTLKQSH